MMNCHYGESNGTCPGGMGGQTGDLLVISISNILRYRKARAVCLTLTFLNYHFYLTIRVTEPIGQYFTIWAHF